jgi:hypothetical protein
VKTYSSESTETMGPGSKDKKKKPYFPPTLTKLTPEQAKKLVADRTHCSAQEAGVIPPRTATERGKTPAER